VKLFVPHQTSRPAIAALADAARVPMDRTVITVSEHANCGAGGVLIALDAARREGRVGANETMLLAALGGGLSWGAAVFQT
jgi:3-oxoacyl-[acyl-carrier-protein] synthase-3